MKDLLKPGLNFYLGDAGDLPDDLDASVAYYWYGNLWDPANTEQKVRLLMAHVNSDRPVLVQTVSPSVLHALDVLKTDWRRRGYWWPRSEAYSRIIVLIEGKFYTIDQIWTPEYLNHFSLADLYMSGMLHTLNT